MAVELPPETLLERAASNSQIRNRCSCAIRTTWSKHQRSFMLFEYPMPVRDAHVVIMLVAS